MTMELSYLLVIWFNKSDSSLKNVCLLLLCGGLYAKIIHYFLLDKVISRQIFSEFFPSRSIRSFSYFDPSIPFCYNTLLYIYNFHSISYIDKFKSKSKNNSYVFFLPDSVNSNPFTYSSLSPCCAVFHEIPIHKLWCVFIRSNKFNIGCSYLLLF